MGFARKVANRVIFMDEGKIVEDSAKEEFFCQPTVRSRERFPRQNSALIFPVRNRRIAHCFTLFISFSRMHISSALALSQNNTEKWRILWHCPLSSIAIRVMMTR
ncbi:Arginine transport ATP-binding protein ArtM [Leclercia adecarboxylata]|uniref:Arginine transport ATP-binding protein ArtM n=1 Tax=Leclercia adecarboxylata TaxID=83655 RepID=A0A4U9HRN6_9ENTR|nr:Arginine transport ATP-binding protein ArtM [Leclercia adecarboxylata]